jgi:putative photosynthetic complex assembly protein 2
MLEIGLTVLYTLFVWWFATGALLFAQKLPASTYPASLAVMSGLTLISVYCLVHLAHDTTMVAALLGFTAGVVVWGWHEATFLMGFITGPYRPADDEPKRGWRRFLEAAESIIHHEIAIAVTGVGLLWLTWGAENQVGAWTFAVLWVMRISAKINIFLGVPNLHAELLPDHLAHLSRFFARRPMNLLFPFSVTGGTILAVMFAIAASAPGTSPLGATGYTMLATITALAVVEHWCLVLPLSDHALWHWAVRMAERWRGPSNLDLDQLNDTTTVSRYRPADEPCPGRATSLSTAYSRPLGGDR